MADSDDSKHLYSTVDRSSLSNPSEAVSTNIKLEWDIDFDKQTITGSAEHIVKVVTGGATHVDFDSAKINIIGEVLVNGEKGTYTAAPAHEVLGTKLSVDIPAELRTEGTHFTVLFNYSINTDASAMQWLPASATKGLKYPYLFTQSQAIHARSLMPCQDSPGIKTQYTARVTAPKWCTVLMSALADTDKTTEGEKNVFVWRQPNPTPAYLVALAAGNLESREISHRVRVWAEPEVVESVLFKFSEMEDFVQAAEELTGCEYQWGRYDILCLPPSFPYGGMENPCLTFATPTLLAGDMSLADMIAHEIAHSWTGNLVTNHTWDHFWLNEGWTVWLERKITSKVRNNEEFGRLSSQVGWKHLQDDVKLLGEKNPFTALTWKLAFGEDPYNAYSGVPYEKGCNLLMYLEEIVGNELFKQFVFSYIDTFKFSTVTTGAFRDHFVSFFDKLATAEAESNKNKKAVHSKASGGGKKNKRKTKNKAYKKRKAHKSKTAAGRASNAAANAVQAIKGLDWNSLFYSTGLPSDVTSFSNSLSKAAEELARKWIALAATCKTDAPPAGCTAGDLEGWSTMQRNVFLETLQNYTKKSLFTVAFLELVDRTYSFGASKNAEIMLRWQTLCLESEAQWIVEPVVDFITSQGHLKFVRPLYRLLRASIIGEQIAIDTFEAKKGIYHPNTRKILAADLRRAADAEEKQAIESQLNAKEGLDAAKPASAPTETEMVAVQGTPGPATAPAPVEEIAELASLRSTPESSGTTPQDQTPSVIVSPERPPDNSTPAVAAAAERDRSVATTAKREVLGEELLHSPEEMVSFLVSKRTVCTDTFKTVEEFVKAMCTDKFYSQAARRLHYLMDLHKDKVGAVAPDWLHSFTAKEFPGYEADKYAFAVQGSLVQRYQRQVLCYLHAVSVLQHYLLWRSTGRTGTMDLYSFVRSFTGVALFRHLINKGRSSLQTLKEVLLPNSIIANIGFAQFPEMYHKYGPALVANFTVTADFKSRHRTSNKFHGAPEPVVDTVVDEEGSGTDRDSMESVLDGFAVSAGDAGPTDSGMEKHAMVAVGYRYDENRKLYLLIQNWWSYRQFVEMDEAYFEFVNASLHVCKTPQTSVRKSYTMVEAIYMEAADELEQQEACTEDY